MQTTQNNMSSVAYYNGAFHSEGLAESTNNAIYTVVDDPIQNVQDHSHEKIQKNKNENPKTNHGFWSKKCLMVFGFVIFGVALMGVGIGLGSLIQNGSEEEPNSPSSSTTESATLKTTDISESEKPSTTVGPTKGNFETIIVKSSNRSLFANTYLIIKYIIMAVPTYVEPRILFAISSKKKFSCYCYVSVIGFNSPKCKGCDQFRPTSGFVQVFFFFFFMWSRKIF